MRDQTTWTPPHVEAGILDELWLFDVQILMSFAIPSPKILTLAKKTKKVSYPTAIQKFLLGVLVIEMDRRVG